MEMPRPTDDHKKLERLAGTWKGTETMHPSEWKPEGGTAQGTTVARVSLGGFAVVCDYQQECDGQTVYQGHGVYTWNAEEQRVVLYWFDSMAGACEQFVGGWSGDRLCVESHNPMMGRMRLTYDFRADGRLGSKMERSADGEQWQGMFDAVYERAD